MGSKKAALARADALHTALTRQVLDGDDLERISIEVSGVLGLGIVVTSTDGREMAAGGVDAVLRARLRAAGLLDPTGRLRVERVPDAGLRVASDNDSVAGQVRCMPIRAGDGDLGRLVAIDASGEIGADDVQALERVAIVAALVITREQAVAAVQHKYQADFLRDLFLGRAVDATWVAEHAETFGWRLDRPVRVVCAEIDPPGEDDQVPGSQQREWQARFARAWRQVTRDAGRGIPTADFSSEVATLLPEVDGLLDRVVKGIAGDRGGGRRSFAVGVSRVTTGLDGLSAAYAQARRAVELGRRVHGPGSVTHFDDLGVHRLIALVPDQAELRDFAEDVLGPLAARTDEAADLRNTLQVLIDTNFNIAEAARAQFFHYNTMRYRVGKLERLLGPLSSDPHLRLDAAVALRALDALR